MGTCVGTLIATDCGLDGTPYNALNLRDSRVRGIDTDRRRTGMRVLVVPSLAAGWSSSMEGIGASVVGHGRRDAESRGYPLGVSGKRGPPSPGESIR